MKEKLFYCKIMIINNEADCDILEPYFISKFNPQLNGEFNTLDKCTFDIKYNYKMSKLIKIFK